MGASGGIYSTAYSVGRDDGLDAHLFDLLQPPLLPEIRVRTFSAAKGTLAPRSESAFCVVPDHTCTNLRERLCHGVHVLLRNEDHELPQGSSRRQYAQRSTEAESPCQGDGHACGGCVVARVSRVDCETVTDGHGQEASRIGDRKSVV